MNGVDSADDHQQSLPQTLGRFGHQHRDEYQVTAFSGGVESDPSNLVTAGGCILGGGPVEVTYYLHSDPTPPNWHGDAPPPLTMDETAPAHDTLYDYNDPGGANPGRLGRQGRWHPSGAPDPDNYLAWHYTTPGRRI